MDRTQDRSARSLVRQIISRGLTKSRTICEVRNPTRAMNLAVNETQMRQEGKVLPSTDQIRPAYAVDKALYPIAKFVHRLQTV
jgi:hypothetical protein